MQQIQLDWSTIFRLKPWKMIHYNCSYNPLNLYFEKELGTYLYMGDN